MCALTISDWFISRSCCVLLTRTFPCSLKNVSWSSLSRLMWPLHWPSVSLMAVPLRLSSSCASNFIFFSYFALISTTKKFSFWQRGVLNSTQNEINSLPVSCFSKVFLVLVISSSCFCWDNNQTLITQAFMWSLGTAKQHIKSITLYNY